MLPPPPKRSRAVAPVADETSTSTVPPPAAGGRRNRRIATAPAGHSSPAANPFLPTTSLFTPFQPTSPFVPFTPSTGTELSEAQESDATETTTTAESTPVEPSTEVLPDASPRCEAQETYTSTSSPLEDASLPAEQPNGATAAPVPAWQQDTTDETSIYDDQLVEGILSTSETQFEEDQAHLEETGEQTDTTDKATDSLYDDFGGDWSGNYTATADAETLEAPYREEGSYLDEAPEQIDSPEQATDSLYDDFGGDWNGTYTAPSEDSVHQHHDIVPENGYEEAVEETDEISAANTFTSSTDNDFMPVEDEINLEDHREVVSEQKYELEAHGDAILDQSTTPTADSTQDHSEAHITQSMEQELPVEERAPDAGISADFDEWGSDDHSLHGSTDQPISEHISHPEELVHFSESTQEQVGAHEEPSHLSDVHSPPAAESTTSSDTLPSEHVSILPLSDPTLDLEQDFSHSDVQDPNAFESSPPIHSIITALPSDLDLDFTSMGAEGESLSHKVEEELASGETGPQIAKPFEFDWGTLDETDTHPFESSTNQDSAVPTDPATLSIEPKDEFGWGEEDFEIAPQSTQISHSTSLIVKDHTTETPTDLPDSTVTVPPLEESDFDSWDETPIFSASQPEADPALPEEPTSSVIHPSLDSSDLFGNPVSQADSMGLATSDALNGTVDAELSWEDNSEVNAVEEAVSIVQISPQFDDSSVLFVDSSEVSTPEASLPIDSDDHVIAAPGESSGLAPLEEHTESVQQDLPISLADPSDEILFDKVEFVDNTSLPAVEEHLEDVSTDLDQDSNAAVAPSQSHETPNQSLDFEEEEPETTEEDDFCEIDATSRRVLSSLSPLDTSIHSIQETDDETGSIASAGPSSPKLSTSAPKLEPIQEDEFDIDLSGQPQEPLISVPSEDLNFDVDSIHSTSQPVEPDETPVDELLFESRPPQTVDVKDLILMSSSEIDLGTATDDISLDLPASDAAETDTSPNNSDFPGITAVPASEEPAEQPEVSEVDLQPAPIDYTMDSSIAPTEEPELAQNEEDVIFNELDPLEAESMFNQYKDSLREHQAILKQLLEDRETMRLELEKVTLNFAPLSQLSETLSSLELDYDQLSQNVEPESEAASELAELENTMTKYRETIERRSTETTYAPVLESHALKAFSDEHPLPTDPSTEDYRDNTDSISPPSPPALASTTAMELSKKYVGEVENLREQLEAANREIESRQSQIDSLHAQLNQLGSQLQKLRETESENEIAQEELKQELAEAQKRIDKLVQDESALAHIETIKALEAELASVREETKAMSTSFASIDPSTLQDMLVFDGTEPIEEVNSKVASLVYQRAQTIVEAQSLRVQVESLLEKLNQTERRLNVEVRALDSQLEEKETELLILRERLQNSTSDAPADLHDEMDKLRKGYELTKTHLSKCEKDLEAAVSRADELDQLWKAECQLRSELQQQHRQKTLHPESDKGPQLIEAENKLVRLEEVLFKRNEYASSLEKDIDQLKRTISGLEGRTAESQKLRAKQEEVIESLRQQIGSMEREAASRSSDTEASLNESLASRELHISELESELSRLTDQNSELTKEVTSLKSTLGKLERRYTQFKSSHEQDAGEISQLRVENESLRLQLESATKSQQSAESLIDEKSALLNDLTNELASVQAALESVQKDMVTAPTSDSPSLTPPSQTIKINSPELEAEIEELATELQVFKAQLEESSTDRTLQRERISQLESSVSSAEREQEAMRNQLESARRKLEEEEKRSLKKIAELEDSTSLLKDIQSDLEITTAAHQQSLDRIKELETEIEACRNEVEHLQTALSQASSSTVLAAQLAPMEQELAALKEENKELLSSHEKLAAQLTKLDAAKTQAETLASSLQEDLRTSQASCNHLSAQVESLQVSLSQAESALRAALDQPPKVVEASTDPTELAELKAQLEQKDKMMMEAYAAFESELGYYAQDLEEQFKERLATATSTAATSADPQILQRLKEYEAQIQQLESLLEQEKTQRSISETQLSSVTSQLSDLRQKHDATNTQLAEISSQHSSATQDLEALRAEASTASMTLQEVQESNRSLVAELRVISSELHQRSEQVTALSGQVEELQQAAGAESTLAVAQDESSQRLALLESSLDAALSSRDALEIQFMELQQQSQALKGQNEELIMTNQDLQSTADELLASSANSESTIADLKHQLDRATHEAQQFKTTAESHHQAQVSLESTITSLESHAKSKDTLIQELRARVSSLEQAMVTQQSDISAAHAKEVASLNDRIDQANRELETSKHASEMTAAESALIAKQKADLETESLRKELESLKALRAEIVPITSASLPIAADYSSSAVLDDWGNDDGWETASPVEPQAELEYLRSFVRTKIQENDELKQQLSQRSEGDVQKKVIDPKSDTSSLFATPSRLANSTSSITRTSSPALSMIPDTEAKDLFGDDGGWDDLEFEPISNSKSSAPDQSPHPNGVSSVEPVSMESDIKKIEQLTSEIENLNTRLESLKTAERQNETLKKALGMRDQELTEITEQYNALNVEYGDLKAQLETLEAELEEHRHNLEQATQQLQKAQQSSPMVRSTSTEDAQSSTLGAELTRAKATIHTLQTLLAAKPPSGSITKDSSEENGWGDDFDDLEETKKPDIKSLENEIDALRHLGEQKDSLLSNLRLEIVSLNSTIATLESERTSPKSHHEGESHEDVAARLAQAVETERAHWTSKISDLDETHQKQLEELELVHLTHCEQLEATNAETLKSQLESALQTVRVEADKDTRRRIHEIEEIHASQKEILESKLAKVSLEKQEVEKEKLELQSRLASKTDELTALNAKIQNLQSSVPDATILANLTQENHHLRGELEDLRRAQNGSNTEIMEELEQLRSARDSSESSTQALKESYQFELENVKQLQLDAEARMANYQNKALELSSTVDQLKADLKAKHDLLQQKEAQVVDLQARLQKERSSRDSTLMTAEETNLEVRDENSRLKSQLDQTRKSLQALRTNQDEQNQALNALRTQESQSAAQIKLYLDRISQLQALLDKPAAPIVSWAEEQLVSQSAIAERLTTENLKLSKGLVSGLVDQQTPVERLASAKAQLQDRVDRLERDLKRIKGELAARTEERDSLRTKVDSLNSDKADLKRQLSASSSRLHSPAAHFAAYSSTPSSPYAYSSPSFAPGTPGSP